MQELQLVGFTTDRRGFILCSAGSSSERFVLPVTDQLRELVANAAPPDAAPVPDATADEAPARPRSQLSVRDIQARLRAGEPVAQVATAAGADEDWIERFAPPVRAEQRQVVERALDAHLRRARGAPSALPLRRAVATTLAERGIAFTSAAFDAAWSAHLLGPDRWAVELSYRHRGARTVRWVYDATTGELTTADRAASQLGYVAVAPAEAGGPALDGIVGDPLAAPITTEATAPARRRPAPEATGADGSAPKPSPAADAASSSATGTAKAKATKATKAAPKKAVPKKATAKTAPKKPVAKKGVPTKATAKTAAPKKAVAKKSPAKDTPATSPAAENGAVAHAPPLEQVVPTTRPVPSVPAPAPPATNGHRVPEPPVVAVDHGHVADAVDAPDAADRVDARRARAAERTAPTVQFRSGAAEPVRDTGAATPDRPVIRRRRQLRAR